MSVEKTKYNLPAGYSSTRSIMNSYRFLKDPIKFISGNMEKFSGTYTAIMPPKNQILIITQNPDFVNYVLRENHTNYHKSGLSADRAATFFGKGLLFSNGEDWLRQRRLIQPGFHREKIHGLYEIVGNSIKEFLSTFPTGEEIDIYPLMHRLAFNIVIKSLFDFHLSSETMSELSRNFSETQDFYIKDINQPFRRVFYPLSGAKTRILRKSEKIKQILKGIIEQRRSSRESYSDLLDMLLNSKYEDTGLTMSENQIIDEILVFIFAGHETTANTLSWLLYLIASNTDVLDKLTKSIDKISIYESVKDEYISAVIQEGMRLYPAAWMTDRVALKDDKFGTFSYPRGTIIIPYFYGIHRDKGYWVEESKFSPERFVSENSKEKKSKHYFPFGAGPRMCIGNNFAMAEMSFFLYIFLKDFTIKKTEQIPKTKPLLTLRPDKIILNIKRLGK